MQPTIPYQLTNFKKDVLDQSQHIPVLVDYWASWCEPCMFLGPIVEKLAEEASDKWKLIKINTEEHSEIANEWGIRGIPNLKLFYKGQVIADLAGAMPEPEMRIWIDQKLPSEAKSLMLEASEQFAIGNSNAGIKLLERAIAVDNNFKEAKLLLAKHIIWDEPARVLKLVNEINHIEEAEELALIANFITKPLLDSAKDTETKMFAKVQAYLQIKKIEPAIELLIKAISVNNGYKNGLGEKLSIAIFRILGESNAVTQKYRRQFDKALY